MAYRKLLIFLYFLHIACCDWVVDWMQPVQDKLRQKAASRRLMDEDVVKMVQIKAELPESLPHLYDQSPGEPHIELKVGFKNQLEETLSNAEDLLEKLQMQIAVLESKEKKIKDAIANGRSGVSTVTVSTAINQPPRTYIVREGVWSICHGMVQYPAVTSAASKANMFNDIFAAPRCIGQEVSTKQDPCVFNSVIKYETVPDRRSVEYNEGDFFCLKPSFYKSLEQYLSVPKIIINNTCQHGVVRSLKENMQQCGQRILSEYTYYPVKANAASLYPLEYCKEKDGSCKLIVAWHVSNKTVENFEFLKKEDNFKKYFIKPSFVEQIL